MELSAILAIAQRDFTKLLRDVPRFIGSLLSPFILIGVLGGTIQSIQGDGIEYDYITFVFTGVLAQTLFSSAAAGVISLIEDRENDFSQELFVSPVSRYSIVLGKILGETLVALPQGVATIIFGFIIGVPISAAQLVALLPVMLVAALLGSAFGLVIMSNLSSARTVNTVIGFIIFPQFFLAGVFAPIGALPPALELASRLAPMRYVVDLARGIFYSGLPDSSAVVVDTPLTNIIVIGVLFILFLTAGTWLFVRSERNR
ncbi:MAG: ABC transporter permease [Chloroflexi bacterium]|nr:ABC transporter permease [Chloroflexota bacterium]